MGNPKCFFYAMALLWKPPFGIFILKSEFKGFTKDFCCTSVFNRFSQFAHQWPDDVNPVFLDGFNVVLTGLENLSECHHWLLVLCTRSHLEPVSNSKDKLIKIFWRVKAPGILRAKFVNIIYKSGQNKVFLGFHYSLPKLNDKPTDKHLWTIIGLKQGSSNLSLEVQPAAEFSPNPDQTPLPVIF